MDTAINASPICEGKAIATGIIPNSPKAKARSALHNVL